MSRSSRNTGLGDSITISSMRWQKKFWRNSERRLCAATGQASWPVLHRIADTKTMRLNFSGGCGPSTRTIASSSARLVTPVVQGIRVRGRFAPPRWASKETLPTWVLLDGQGIGHEQGEATKINRAVPPELARKFFSADLICLVDRAVPAMTGDAPVLLETPDCQRVSGTACAHLHAFRGCRSSRSGLGWQEGKGTGRREQRHTEHRILAENAARYSRTHRRVQDLFPAGHLNQSEIKQKSTQAELKRICDHIKRSAGEPEIPKFRPLYNEYQIANVVLREIRNRTGRTGVPRSSPPITGRSWRR